MTSIEHVVNLQSEQSSSAFFGAHFKLDAVPPGHAAPSKNNAITFMHSSLVSQHLVTM